MQDIHTDCVNRYVIFVHSLPHTNACVYTHTTTRLARMCIDASTYALHNNMGTATPPIRNGPQNQCKRKNEKKCMAPPG